MTIFLTHAHSDKPVVEPVAIRLAGIFGQDRVFYDSWSVQPGDGIIKRMNEGLDAPAFVFFFVSTASLQSKMVELEWQNALYQSTRGKTRIVPVRVDGAPMPPLLVQNLYLDMFANGVEAVIQQMVSLVQGQSTFTPQHIGFSNLTFEVTASTPDRMEICVSASHLLEPDPAVMVLSDSPQSGLTILIANAGAQQNGFHPAMRFSDGSTANGFFVAPISGSISPGKPLRLTLTSRTGGPVSFRGLMRRQNENLWESIPRKP